MRRHGTLELQDISDYLELPAEEDWEDPWDAVLALHDAGEAVGTERELEDLYTIDRRAARALGAALDPVDDEPMLD